MHFPSNPNRWQMAIPLAAIVLAVLPCAEADDFSHRDSFFRRLSGPMTSIVDGKPFRDGLVGIANQAELNLWVDRVVDPTTPIVAGPLRPTVYAAIQKLAAKRDCVVMPVANVVLVGRPSWVDRTAASILSLKLADNPEPADIAWDDLTTPAEAMSRATGNSVAVRVEPELPHDLWPATSWHQIDRRVAVTLILAQFDRRPERPQSLSTASLRSLTSIAASDAGTFTRRYLADAKVGIRDTMSEADPKSRVRSAEGWLEARGGVAAHRAVADAMLASSDAPPPDPNNDTFTLKKMVTTAENALVQLARSARRECVIDDEAREACKREVVIEGKDATLKQLIDMVAQQAGLVAQWQNDKILISLAE